MKENLKKICQNKLYRVMLCLTAVCSYGFLLTHQTVGIDDTPYSYYFEEGMNAIIGRWFLFLLNKIFHISDFSPFIMDFVGALTFMAAVTVWCALLYSICKESVPIWGYTFFACIFLSCPLISEVYTYYLHNGISAGYLCTGISLCYFKELTGRMEDWKKRVKTIACTAAFLLIALGCYESFMVVWLVGIFLILLTELYMRYDCKVFTSLLWGVLTAVVTLILRSLVIAGIIGIFNLGEMQGDTIPRSILEITWMSEPEAFAEFAMALKRVFVMYGVFAYAYYPIRIFLFASGVMVIMGIWGTIRRKNGWFILLTIGCFIASFLLVIVEGKVTLYRAAQFLPVICGYGVFLTAYAAEQIRTRKISPWIYRIGKKLLIFVLCVVLWNQCFDMNKWFYVDWLKYESAVDLARQIAQTLEQNFDTSKPIVFTGSYQAPYGIIKDAYVEYNSKTFRQMKWWTDKVDEHLLDKYYRDYGVWVAQTPALSVIDWGINAFESDAELVRFFSMHGYELRANMDNELFESACLYSVGLPRFPQEGSIVDMGDYIIVHF